jgi:hypothetical protein
MTDLVRVDDLTIHQADDRPLVWTLADVDGASVNLDGYSAVAQVRTKPHATTVLHEWSTPEGNAVLAESAVTLKVDDSETWAWRSGVYDLHITDPSGRTEVIARGKITLIPAVTR